MSRSVFWALVRKDLYLQRGFMLAVMVVGVLAYVTMSFGGRALAVGGILFITANVAGAIFIAVHTLVTERKELSRMFALSLPISGSSYYMSKLTSGYLSFGIPWALLTVMVVLGTLLVEASDRGMVVYALLIQLFVLAQFSVVMAALFVAATEMASGVVIVGVNIAFSLFMMQINQPGITAPWKSDAIVWTPFAQQMLAGELAAIVIAFGVAIPVLSRRRDHL